MMAQQMKTLKKIRRAQPKEGKGGAENSGIEVRLQRMIQPFVKYVEKKLENTITTEDMFVSLVEHSSEDVYRVNLIKISIALKSILQTGRICVTLQRTTGETVKHVDGPFASMQDFRYQ